MNRLDIWYKQIEGFRNISIDEAKRMYNAAINEEDDSKRKAIFNELICGTLYVVLNHIRDNNFNMVCRTSLDIDDYVNAFIEEWIKVIYSGKFMDVRAFSLLFHLDYYYNFSNTLTSYNYGLFTNSGISTVHFKNIFKEYLEYRNNYLDISYDKFIEIINKYGYYCSDKERYVNAYNMFNNIYMNMNIDRLGDTNIAMTRINNFRYLLVNNSLETTLDNNISCSFENNVLDKYYVDGYIDYYNKTLLSSNERYVLEHRGIFNDEVKSYEDIGKDLGLTHERVGQIALEGIGKLRSKIINFGVKKGKFTL